MKNNTEKWATIFAFILIGTSIVGMAIYLLYFYKAGYLSSTSHVDHEVSGNFGALFGGLFGTAISLSAVLLVWATYNVQRRELRNTKSLMQKQQFETTFFNLLKMQNDIKNGIEFDTKNVLSYIENKEPTGVVHEAEFFSQAKDDFYRLFDSDRSLSPKIIVKVWQIDDIVSDDTKYEIRIKKDFEQLEKIPHSKAIERINKSYRLFFDYYKGYLGGFFNMLFYILSFLDQKS